MSSYIWCLAHCRCLINGSVVICVLFFKKAAVIVLLLANDTLIETPVTNDMHLEDGAKGKAAACIGERGRK